MNLEFIEVKVSENLIEFIRNMLLGVKHKLNRLKCGADK